MISKLEHVFHTCISSQYNVETQHYAILIRFHLA